MSLHTKALLAIVLASLLWSTVGISKIVISEFDPFFAAFLRFFVASVAITPLFLREKLSKRMIYDLLPIALAATGNIIFYYLGLQNSTANAAVLIYAGVPLVIAVIAHYTIDEKLTKEKLVGILIGLIGVIFIVMAPIIESGGTVSGNLLGNIFFALAVLIWSLYTIGSRHAITAKKYSPIAITSLSVYTGSIILFCFSLFSFQPSYWVKLQQPSIIFIVLYLGTLVTVATLILYQWGLKHSSATTASLNNYLMPFFAVIVNSLVLKESIPTSFLGGGILIFIGVILTTGRGFLKLFKST